MQRGHALDREHLRIARRAGAAASAGADLGGRGAGADHRRGHCEGEDHSDPLASGATADVLAGDSVTLSPAYGVSCRARAERAALRHAVRTSGPTCLSIRPRNRCPAPVGSPAPGRRAARGLGLCWRGSITSSQAASAGVPALSSAGYHARPAARLGAALFLSAATAQETSVQKTYQANAQDRERDWYLVDAEGKTLGRLATQIADVLRGKRKPEYTPARRHRRLRHRRQRRQDPRDRQQARRQALLPPSGLPGRDSLADARGHARASPRGGHPQGGEGMLPRNRLARQQLPKLKVYAGPDHPHQAQKPEPLEIETVMADETRRRERRGADARSPGGPRP